MAGGNCCGCGARGTSISCNSHVCAPYFPVGCLPLFSSVHLIKLTDPWHGSQVMVIAIVLYDSWANIHEVVILMYFNSVMALIIVMWLDCVSGWHTPCGKWWQTSPWYAEFPIMPCSSCSHFGIKFFKTSSMVLISLAVTDSILWSEIKKPCHLGRFVI